MKARRTGNLAADKTVEAEIAELTRQRDEAVEALEKILEAVEKADHVAILTVGPELTKAIDKARQYFASIKEAPPTEGPGGR